MIGSSLVLTPGSLPINQAFTQYVKNIGQILPFNLSRPTEEISRINSIIGKYTKSTIKNMISNDTKLINDNTNIILLTTAYYRGKFKIPFSRNNIQQSPFKGLNGGRYVPMLRQRDSIHRYYEDATNKIIELDYTDGDFAMGIILPKVQSRLHLSHEMYEYYVSQLAPTYIGNLAIPKFQQSSKFKIDNIFKSMGMIETFMNADFSEITPSNEVLYISDIIHQSVITVEESDSNVRTPRPTRASTNPKDFIADHHFIYYIRYLPVNVVVLNGYYC
jgi:serine protease inhibitor